jgi:hypothetical protein
MSGEAAYTNFIVNGLTYTFISNEFEGKNTIQNNKIVVHFLSCPYSIAIINIVSSNPTQTTSTRYNIM